MGCAHVTCTPHRSHRALAGIAALTACSGSSKGDGDKPVAAPAAKPITEALAQAVITQALLGDGETLPGWTLHGDKDVTDGDVEGHRKA
ncbi:hypothetical protein [Streptomyces luteolus]|uniref:Uncharacterized protein n=1 Tax=Streptomyces luteolus TaxID=3043615 RepID=A0ABT6SPC2_9ACTN|nr:hypothetical protein [Streptomyces sp. B-S-A12]MDI3417463.1 hypothetical protein [Streptomyces sp. B-S-A12]